MLRRLKLARPAIEERGHTIRFAVARGPLNVAAFLMGTMEFVMATKTNPAETHQLLELISDYMINWIRLQKEEIPTIDGILLLDDIVGFFSPEDVREFALPYLKRVFAAFDARVRFFHNDADGRPCAPVLNEMGVNLFNYSYKHSMREIRQLAGPKVALLGGIAPRDVLALGTEEQVRKATRRVIDDAGDMPGIIFSVGGGVSPGTPTRNIRAFLDEIFAGSKAR